MGGNLAILRSVICPSSRFFPGYLGGPQSKSSHFAIRVYRVEAASRVLNSKLLWLLLLSFEPYHIAAFECLPIQNFRHAILLFHCIADNRSDQLVRCADATPGFRIS